MDENSAGNFSCSSLTLRAFSSRMEKKMLQVNGLVLLNAILMGGVVFIGVFAPRYRRHSIIGFIFRGANTLFLPIVSVVASTVSTEPFTAYFFNGQTLTAQSEEGVHYILILIWSGLVTFVGISTCAVVAGDPREGSSTIGPSTELLIKVIWVAYLMVRAVWSSLSLIRFIPNSSFAYADDALLDGIRLQAECIFVILLVINLSKIFQKYRVFYVSRRSFTLGRNPRLTASYMARLDEEGQVPPPLIVMEGGTLTLEEQPRGYSFKLGTMGPEDQQQRSGLRCFIKKKKSGLRRVETRKGSELVTLDIVWRLNDGSHFSRSTPQAKDLCFSFALFKLLRCRFAEYTVSEAGFMKARQFFWDTYLQGADQYSRVFRVIADELSFVHDYYYSTMSIPFFHRRFLFARVLNQVLSIGLCLYIFEFMSHELGQYDPSEQVVYGVSCDRGLGSDSAYLPFGHLYYDMVPVYLVLAAILISEIKETVSYLCSNFTKVVLVCNYVSNTCCPKSVVAFAFKHLRCNWLLDSWNDEMSQSKLLVFRPWEVSILLRRLFRLPNQKKIKVPAAVKKAIFEALQGLASEHEGQTLKHIRLPWSPIPNSHSATVDARLACDGKGAADTILAWHIATSIFEVRHPQPQPTGGLLGCKTAAVRLSQYCAYLVCYRPELLPDDVEWCKSLRGAVNDEAARVLAGRAATPTPEDEFQQLVRLLNADSNHAVLKHGARLAEELVGSGAGWEALARFWSEMTLYIAPSSENLDAHAEAISRGGELITLLWALLAHAGVADRLDAEAFAANSDSGSV